MPGMELADARILIAGASGAVGGRLAVRLAAAGARLHLAGRDTAALGELATETGGSWSAFDVADPSSVHALVGEAAERLGGLDALVVSVGVPAFGAAQDTAPAVHRRLFDVNAVGPMDLVAAALPRIEDGGAVCAITAILADLPTAGMAAYSASKAALGAYLTATRRELRRRRISVLDVRAPHLDTPFAERALAGDAPELPPAMEADALADAIVEALAEGRTALGWDLRERRLAVR